MPLILAREPGEDPSVWRTWERGIALQRPEEELVAEG